MSSKKEREIKPAPKREREEAAASSTSIDSTVGATLTASNIGGDARKKAKKKQQIPKQETKQEMEENRLQEEQAWHFWDDRDQTFPNGNSHITEEAGQGWYLWDGYDQALPKENKEKQAFEIEIKETKKSPTKKRPREGEGEAEQPYSNNVKRQDQGGDVAEKQEKAEQVVSSEANAAPEKKSDTSNPSFNDLPDDMKAHLIKFVKHTDLPALALTNKAMSTIVADEKNWQERIKIEFKRTFPEVPHRLEAVTIYRQLNVYSSLSLSERNTYSEDDPALFQSQLPEGTSLAFRTHYLLKAARVGNLALVKWLVSPERGAMRVYASRSTLNAALQSGNLELVQWLESVERGDQRVCFNKFSLNKAMEGKSSPAVIKMLLKQNISWVRRAIKMLTVRGRCQVRQ